MFGLIPWRGGLAEPSGLTTTDPFDRELSRMSELFDTLTRRFWGDWPAPSAGWFARPWSWDLGYEETDTEYVARFEAPGYEVDDFDIQIRGDQLVVRAERKQEGGDGYRYGRFERVMSLPEGVDEDKIEARYHSGVLELHLPKSEEARGKRIPVQAA